jgi:hypothetical protein
MCVWLLYMYVYVYMCIYVCIHVCMCTCVYMYVYVYICVHACYMCMCMCVPNRTMCTFLTRTRTYSYCALFLKTASAFCVHLHTAPHEFPMLSKQRRQVKKEQCSGSCHCVHHKKGVVYFLSFPFLALQKK